jgi:hypothetical protein
MKIRLVGAKLSHVDGDTRTDRQTDIHEANSRFSQFFESA